MIVIRLRALAGVLAAMTFLGGCGDRTVTSHPIGPEPAPAATTSAGANAPGASPPGAAATADSDLAEVDRLLDEIESEVTTADREATTPEGDPTS